MKIKTVSLNLWNGGRLMEPVLDFLRDQAADVVFLQEAYDGTEPNLELRFRSMRVLAKKLRYPHAEFAPAMLDKLPEGNIPAGNAILSKYALSASDTVFFNEPFHELTSTNSRTFRTMPRILQHVTAKTPAGLLNLLNVHGVWDLDGDNFGERRREMRDKILRIIMGKPNIILAGDTNAQPTNKMWEAIEQPLVSVFGTELKSTFNMKHKTNPGYATARVDMIFTSPNIKVLEKRCHEVDVSDHLPLSATLEITS
ncbi:MAG TPA: endonuclease/exonuclease/phosphatase family protein [Candidatus Saccharimonadales bacterium]|nr:endonuclease/exonuclease/phosphatase family protein [Candidatus Saccharimonadales bacterium]